MWRDGNRGWFNPEALEYLLEQMAQEAGAELLYYTLVEDVIVDEDVLRGVVVANKAGRAIVRAKRTVDASGDADVAALAGVPFESGELGTGRNQPFSVRFNLGNVDVPRLAEFLASLGRHDVMASAEGTEGPLVHTAMVWGKGWTLEPVFRQAVADGVLQESDGDYFQAFSMAGRPGELAFNCPRIGDETDGTDPFHLTRAQVRAREITRRYVAFCRGTCPAANAPTWSSPRRWSASASPAASAASTTSPRRTCSARASSTTRSCRNNYPLDIHRDPNDARPSLTKLPNGEYHEVPYRCLVPLGIEHLLVAGRCLSASFEAQSSVRIQPNCRAMGQAAGLAAALSIHAGITPRAQDGVELRTALRVRGASL